MPVYPNPPARPPLDTPSLTRSPMEARLRGFAEGALGGLKKLLPADPAGQIMSAVGGPMTVLADEGAAIPAVLRGLFASNPEAEPAYLKALRAQIDERNASALASAQADNLTLKRLQMLGEMEGEPTIRMTQTPTGQPMLARSNTPLPAPSPSGTPTRPPLSGRWNPGGRR